MVPVAIFCLKNFSFTRTFHNSLLCFFVIARSGETPDVAISVLERKFNN